MNKIKIILEDTNNMFTVKELMTNITKGQVSVPSKYVFKILDEIYNTIKSKIKIVKAEDSNNGTNIYLKIPSEDFKNIYDVVFWFNSSGKISLNTKLKVYANSPHFGYSYAYIFNKKDSLLFPHYYPSIMILKHPKTRNPFEVVGFDKHTWAGLKHIYKQKLDFLVGKSNPSINPNIMTFEEKIKSLKK